ncbi:hypothetical protein FTO68_11155 [Methanocalculus taiwanensis]|uniref:Glycosyltransferase RgtA/B/C/D-like domain-containing protein n=1 Tax=Methanocalculus taiwanensis TaxID=106207 RepID=A0ABD4TP41_9EURY|nr:hypothetical protein [Methanocalculus taiwanensis]MCQ1539534.1 hypothetical protein [Methanocalculus taiwanensis]
MLGLALSLASLIYLLIKNRKNTSDTFVSKSIKIIIEVTFFILFVGSLLILHVNTDRPSIYFIIIALSSGFLALSILSVQTRIEISLQIVKIFLVSFNLKYSLFLSYWGVGVDYWGHLLDNYNLTQYGFIEVLSGKEVYFPLMHIQVAVNQIITGSPIKDATNFGIIIPLVCSSVCVFLIAQRLLNVKIGLLALLLVNISDFHIMWGSSPQTTTFGIVLFFFLIYTIIIASLTTTHRMLWSMLSLIILVSISLNHAISSFITFFTILGLLIGSIIYNFIFNNERHYIPPIIFFFLFSIILIHHWDIALYHGLEGEVSFFEKILSGFQFDLTEYAGFLNRPETIPEYITALPPFLERVAETIGLTILIGFSVIGGLFWLSNNYKNKLTFSILISSVIILFVTFAFPMMGIRNIMPTRWFAFIYFFLSILAAFAIIILLMKTTNHCFRIIGCFLLIFILTFFMTANTISNLDSPLWLKESSISTTYTYQEGIGAESITRISNRVMSDTRYFSLVSRTNYQAEAITFQEEQQLGNTPDTVFMWRNYMLNRPIMHFQRIENYDRRIKGTKILGIEFFKDLEKYNKIYMNDGITGYYLQ